MKNNDYDAVKNDADRRAVLAKFLLDNNIGKLTGKYTTTVSTTNRSRMREVWLTEKQLASPQYMNCEMTAGLMIKTMTSRKQKMKVLRDAGIDEYQHFVEWADKDLEQRSLHLRRTRLSWTQSNTTWLRLPWQTSSLI